MVFCAALNCLNYSKSKVSTFKFPANSKLRKQWLLKMKRKEFQPEKTLAFVRFILPKTTSEKIWQYVGFWVLISRLHLKEDAVRRTIFFVIVVRKRNHGEECLPKHKDPTVRSAFAKRRKLKVCILHLSYST